MSLTKSWIKKIEPELKNVLDLSPDKFSIPLDINLLASQIGKKLNTEPLSLEIGNQEWKSKDSFFSGFSQSPLAVAVSVEKECGNFFWILEHSDVETLISWMKDLSGKTFEIKHKDLIKGIYQYISLVCLEVLAQNEIFESYSLKLLKDQKLPDKGYSIDVCITHNEKKIWGRLILTQELKLALSKKFSKESIDITEIAKKFPNLSVPLIISNGSIELNRNELESLEVGDFVRIDNAFFKPKEEKGSLKLSLSNKPLFQIKLKDGKFKILDYIYDYSEEAVYAE
jgi:hypothetical protein